MTTIALTLKGELSAENAIPWFLHRGRLLNLVGWIERTDAHTIAMVLWGPADLLDAMEVACSLGPANVLVEDLIRSKHGFEDAPETFEFIEASVIA